MKLKGIGVLGQGRWYIVSECGVGNDVQEKTSLIALQITESQSTFQSQKQKVWNHRVLKGMGEYCH